MVKIAVLIVAGGSGTRLNLDTPKQYLGIGGMTVINRTYNIFNNNKKIDHIAFVINKNHENHFVKSFPGEEVDYCFGGNERNHSVRLGLEHLKQHSPDYVLIHDAARPFTSQTVIDKVLAKLSPDSGVIAASKITDTVKYVEKSLITKTIPREKLMAAQTPQAFKFDKILELHNKHSDIKVTDDSMLYELEGIDVHLVESPKSNFKITTAEDIKQAEQWLKNEN